MAAYFDETRKTWYCKFRYTDWQGSSRSTSKRGFKTKKEALRYESDQKLKLKEKPQITIQTLSQEFLADYKVNNRASSYTLVNKNCKKYILPFIGQLQLDDVTPIVIKKWQNELLTFELSDSSLCSINTTLSTMFNYAIKFYGMKNNPLRITGKQGSYTRRMDFLEIDDWKKVDASITDIYPKCVLNLLYWSGIRIGELMGLTTKDIDLKAKTISIDKQMNIAGEIGKPKTTYSKRVITIPAVCVNLIKEYYSKLYQKDQYVFAIHNREKINYDLKKYCKKAGVKVISPHALRHSHASFLIKQGIPINSISKRLGHSSPSVTLNIYAHCYQEQDRDIANMIDKALSPLKQKTKKRNVGQM